MVKAIVKSWIGLYCTTDPILGDIMNVVIDYVVADGPVNENRTQTQFQISALDTQATVKANAASAIIADAASVGYTLTATDIRFQDGTRGV